MSICPELRQGCCDRRYCAKTNPYKEVLNWRNSRCVTPEWKDCSRLETAPKA